MKRSSIVVAILVFAILATACGGAATPASPTTQAQPTQPQGEAYPAPESLVDESAYPAPAGEPEQVEWQRAQSAILMGLIYQITERQNLEVVLNLKDGRQFVTTVASLDDVTSAITQCGKACEIIKVVNE